MSLVSTKNESKTDELNFLNACDKGNLMVVKVYLAQQGFDRDVSDNKGRTGFHYACGNGNLNVVQYLLQRGFNMNVMNNRRDNFKFQGYNYQGSPGFHYAYWCGKLNVVQFLVQQGFDMNVGADDGTTGFHLACQNGNLQFLLQRGLVSGTTGFHYAWKFGNLIVLLNQGYIGDYLERAGFHDACNYSGKFNIVQFLLHQEYNMNVVDQEGTTGLHYSCLSEKLNAVQFLVQQGFDMKTTNYVFRNEQCNLVHFFLQQEFNERINEIEFGEMTTLEYLIRKRFDCIDDQNFMPCIFLLIAFWIITFLLLKK